MTTPTVRRPGLVTLVVVLTVIGGILSIIAGIVAFSVAGTLGWAGIVFIILGLIYLAVAKGLANGNNLSRTIVAIVSVIQIVSSIFAIFTAEFTQTRTSGIGSAIISLIILLILYSPKANAFFASR